MRLDYYDKEEIRCPRVGGYVNFKFCRMENNFLPCRWVINCWSQRIEIQDFINEHYDKEDLEKIFQPPRPKMESLLDLVERAKKNIDK